MDDSLGDLASMTHWPEQPNPVAPYLNAAKQKAGAFAQSGLTGAFPQLRQYMPGFVNTLGDLAQSPAARDVFSTANFGGIPLGGTLAGARGFGELAGRTGDLSMADLDMAKQMEKSGKTRPNILAAKQWFRERPSAIWNKEIYDKPSALNQSALPNNHGYWTQNSTVGNILNHPDLYNVYPHLKDLPVTFVNSPVALKEKLGGSYSWPTKQFPHGSITLYNAHIRNPDETKSTLLHELQHSVDFYEGRKFTPQSPDMPDDVYLKLNEEARGRNTEFRANMTPEQLKQPGMAPWDTLQQMKFPVRELEQTLPP